MGLNAACFTYGLQQIVAQWQGLEVRWLDRDQLFAKFLQGQVLAFKCAFAGL